MNIMTNSEVVQDGGIPRKEKVAIIGCAVTTKDLAKRLFDDPSWEFWGVNTLYLILPELFEGEKTIRWFQIHHLQHVIDQKKDYTHLDWLKAQTRIPIYMIEHNPEVPMSIPYPKTEVMQKYGRYFTNTLSWMIALAMYEGMKEIHLYGVEMALSEEYATQRPSIEYYVGLARGMGITVFVPQESNILKNTTLYGFEDHSMMRHKLKYQKIQWMDDLKDAAVKEMGAKNSVQRLSAVIDYIKEKNVSTPEEEMKTLKDSLQKWNEAETKARHMRYTIEGSIHALEYFGQNLVHE